MEEHTTARLTEHQKELADGVISACFHDPAAGHKAAVDAGLRADLFPTAIRGGIWNVLHHFGGQGRPVSRALIVAAARSAWLVARDRDNPERRLFLPLKNNLSKEMPGLAFSILDGAVAWQRGPVAIDANEALAVDPRQDHQQRSEAADWLRETLANGPLASTEVRRLAEENGFSWATLRRTKTLVGVRVDRDGFGPGATWRWSLPDRHGCAGQPIDAIDAQDRNVSPYGESEHLWSEGPPADRHRCSPAPIDVIEAHPQDVGTYGRSDVLCDDPGEPPAGSEPDTGREVIEL